MVRLRSGCCAYMRHKRKGPASCCPTRRQAASKGHDDCYRSLLPLEPEGRSEYMDLYPCLSLALRHGNVDFARRLSGDRQVLAQDFAAFCADENDTVSLQYMLGTGAVLDMDKLCARSARSPDCLRIMLELGAKWVPFCLLRAARDNRLDVLEVVMEQNKAWHPLVPSVAACAGHVRFLIRAIDAGGCPVWTMAQDGEPRLSVGGIVAPAIHPPREKLWEMKGWFVHMEDWSLVVSSDLVLSGPVLLYAAQKGAPLTLRMQGMLGDVRRRALALAGCFHRAARLSRAPGVAARKWGPMGRVPLEIVQNIATLARLSIVALELVE